MKNLLIALLFLGSTSAFADYCLVATKNVDSPHIIQNMFKISKFKDSNILSRLGVATQYGVEKETRLIEMDLKDAFGDIVTIRESQLHLYEAGRVIYSTGFLEDIITNAQVANDLIVDELKKLGCE